MKQIQHTNTLFYYDGPQVFEARDAIGGHYVAVLAPSGGESKTDTWSRASTPNDYGNSDQANTICDRCSSNRTKRYGILWQRRRMDSINH